jgi:hypothetical protein
VSLGLRQNNLRKLTKRHFDVLILGAGINGAVSGDSESAWYAQAVFLRHFSKNRHLDIGWRYYDVDYESGSGLTLFKWDVAHSGPVIGYSWEF